MGAVDGGQVGETAQGEQLIWRIDPDSSKIFIYWVKLKSLQTNIYIGV